MLLTIFLVYLFIINAAGFLLMLTDKARAKKNAWRIPESTLFLAALAGGSIGSLLGMYAFRHKTKHMKFTLGMPLILAAQIILMLLVVDHL